MQKNKTRAFSRRSEERGVRVSYILTTRNRAQFLDEALSNAREFMTDDDELIVIDAASTDNTSEVAEKYRDIITVFKSEPDCGEAHGLNKGILESRGRFIKQITDDDYFYPAAMQRAIAVMEAHPELDAVMCGGEQYHSDPETGEQQFTRYQYLPADRRLTDDENNVVYHVTCGIGLILTRRVISRLGLFDSSFLAVDMDYLAKLMAHKVEFRYLDIKLWRHVNYPHSGENDRARCQWDRLKISVRDRSWNNVICHHESLVAKVLGLDSVKGGPVLAGVLADANWLRLKFPFLLSLLFWLLRSFHRACQLAGKGIRRGRQVISKRPERANSVAGLRLEPDWDESLR